MKRARIAEIAFVVALLLVFGLYSRGSDAANQNVGYVHSVPFGSAPGSDVTADKPQSKLWYTVDNNAATWWAVMFNGNIGEWHIHKLTWPSTWVDTGIRVDDRATSRADVLWEPNTNKLYIASLVRMTTSNQSRLYRYTYSGGTYTLDSGYPVVMLKSDSSSPSNSGSAETMAFDKDSTGRLWITFTQASKVWINSGLDNATDWGKPMVVPDSAKTGFTSIGSDDISSLVAYNERDSAGNAIPSIGVLWSNHTSTSATSMMNFTYHRDSDPVDVWQPIESIYGGTGAGTCLADDHINLKSLQADPSGSIFAAVKTSTGDSSSCTGGPDLIRLVVRNPTTKVWKWAAFGANTDNHTRPIVLLDTTNRKVYMFATSPTSCGVIYMKSSPMDNPNFPSGKGTPFISSSTYTCINNATSTKQTVNGTSGLVVMASDESKLYYLHNVLALGSGGSATATSTNTPVVSSTAMPTSTPTSTQVSGSTATPTSTPGLWTSQDIGTAAGGNSTTNGTAVTVAGAGSDVWGSADSFRYTYQPFNGNADVVGAVTNWTGGGNSWAKGGLMIRSSTSLGAANCFVLVSGGNGIRMQWRLTNGGSTANTTTAIPFSAPSVNAPVWLRLTLNGNVCSAYYSTNGSSWTQVGAAQTISGLGSSYLYGIGVTAHDTTKLALITMDNISTVSQ